MCANQRLAQQPGEEVARRQVPSEGSLSIEGFRSANEDLAFVCRARGRGGRTCGMRGGGEEVLALEGV